MGRRRRGGRMIREAGVKLLGHRKGNENGV